MQQNKASCCRDLRTYVHIHRQLGKVRGLLHRHHAYHLAKAAGRPLILHRERGAAAGRAVGNRSRWDVARGPVGLRKDRRRLGSCGGSLGTGNRIDRRASGTSGISLGDRDSGLSMAQDGVKMAQNKPKTAQDGHKMASRRAEKYDMPIEVKLQGAEARAALSRV